MKSLPYLIFEIGHFLCCVAEMFLLTTIFYVCVCMKGVTVLAVGIGQADREELRQSVTDRSPQNVLYAGTAERLNTVHADLADLLCGIARSPEVRNNMEKLNCVLSVHI